MSVEFTKQDSMTDENGSKYARIWCEKLTEEGEKVRSPCQISNIKYLSDGNLYCVDNGHTCIKVLDKELNEKRIVGNTKTLKSVADIVMVETEMGGRKLIVADEVGKSLKIFTEELKWDFACSLNTDELEPWGVAYKPPQAVKNKSNKMKKNSSSPRTNFTSGSKVSLTASIAQQRKSKQSKNSEASSSIPNDDEKTPGMLAVSFSNSREIWILDAVEAAMGSKKVLSKIPRAFSQLDLLSKTLPYALSMCFTLNNQNHLVICDWAGYEVKIYNLENLSNITIAHEIDFDNSADIVERPRTVYWNSLESCIMMTDPGMKRSVSLKFRRAPPTTFTSNDSSLGQKKKETDDMVWELTPWKRSSVTPFSGSITNSKEATNFLYVADAENNINALPF